jgi:hypothetical protein
MSSTDHYLVKRLRTLLAQVEAQIAPLQVRADGFRAAIAAIQEGEPAAGPPEASPDSVLQAALALDRSRHASTNGSGTTRGGHPLGYGSREAETARRQRTGALLDHFAQHPGAPAPTPKQRRTASILAGKGYLRRKGDGFVRTRKPWMVERRTAEGQAAFAAAQTASTGTARSGRPGPRRGPAKSSSTPKPTPRPAAALSPRQQAMAERRAISAQLLATFDPTIASRLPPGNTVLVRHGYLAKQGDGYVRTEKVFEP